MSAINPNPPSAAVTKVMAWGWGGCHAARPDRASFSEPVTTSHYPFTTAIHRLYPTTQCTSIHVRSISWRMPLASATLPIRLERQDYQLKSSFLRIVEAFRRSRHFQIVQSRNSFHGSYMGIITWRKDATWRKLTFSSKTTWMAIMLFVKALNSIYTIFCHVIHEICGH